MLKLQGIPINQGISENLVFIKIDPVQTLLKKKCTTIDPSKEIENYLNTIDQLQEEFLQIKDRNQQLSNKLNVEMAELYMALLNDPIFKKRIPELITEKKIPASYAILNKLDTIKIEFSKLNNEYFQSRFDDFQSIGYKLLEKLTDSLGYKQISQPVIIVAESISAADILHIPLKYVRGIITEKGSQTSHAAILAESLDIPAIFNVANLIKNINRKDIVIMDGYSGDIIINPEEDVSLYYKKLAQRHTEYEQDIISSSKEAHTTLDNQPFVLLANIGNTYDIPLITKYHADGIGLLRTETMVLLEESLLTEEEQTLYYETLLKETNNMEICFRTLDLGGDKIVQNSDITPTDEDNPFLGFRSTRQFVQDPTEFRKQVKALLRSYHINRNMKILIPFITELNDLLFLKSIIQECYYQLYQSDCTIPIGIMIEVPSSLICITDYLPHVDFVSIGTNDLTQYVLATDRNNTYVSHYHNSANPAIIRLLYYASQECLKTQTPISICGEMAKEPYFIRLLYGLGISQLSMSPTGVPMARYILSHSTQKDCQELASQTLKMQHASEIEIFLNNDLIEFLKKETAYFDNCVFLPSIKKQNILKNI